MPQRRVPFERSYCRLDSTSPRFLFKIYFTVAFRVLSFWSSRDLVAFYIEAIPQVQSEFLVLALMDTF